MFSYRYITKYTDVCKEKLSALFSRSGIPLKNRSNSVIQRDPITVKQKETQTIRDIGKLNYGQVLQSGKREEKTNGFSNSFFSESVWRHSCPQWRPREAMRSFSASSGKRELQYRRRTYGSQPSRFNTIYSYSAGTSISMPFRRFPGCSEIAYSTHVLSGSNYPDGMHNTGDISQNG